MTENTTFPQTTYVEGKNIYAIYNLELCEWEHCESSGIKESSKCPMSSNVFSVRRIGQRAMDGFQKTDIQ